MTISTTKLFFIFSLSLSLLVSISVQATEPIKVMDIESGEIIKEKAMTETLEKEVLSIIKSITTITIEANPVPKKGYLVKVPLTKSFKVKNKWFDEIVNEVIIVYSPATNVPQKIILFTDENKPMFFDVKNDLTQLLKELEVTDPADE
ncbi:hypothetical protein ACFFIX_04205 [Metabacillus herbersteinensis]|uniref:Uncharacterized protein n=1 Tax=Metabacillus herbersteinensis TaxID=283816 RepID=A0ABV6GAE0_9BACI